MTAFPTTYKENILVVDDTPDNLRLLVDILSKKGYIVRPVTNGRLGLSAARGLPPDLILLDIMMPEMDGYEVCDRLKADEVTRDIPVIFISAINDVLDKVKAFRAGGIDYITKPFQIEEVLVRVKTHLAMSSLKKSLQAKNEELSKTLDELKATQSKLVQSEKMALLGQLIAGIGHEINNPLGAIRASIENIAHFVDRDLETLPKFLQQLSPERQQDFFALLHKSSQQEMMFSSRERRQLKKGLIHQLEFQNVANSDIIADILVDLGIYDKVEGFFPLLQDSDSQTILNMAYQFTSLRKSTKTISTATDRAAKIVFALRSYARYDATSEKVEVNITHGIETVLTLYQNQLRQGVEVIKNYADLPPVFCYPDELNQVWTNIIHNALQAMDYKGILTIATTQQDTRVLISITDTGKGIPLEIQNKIFEPFYTTKSAGEGSGLGLDIVQKIIEKHQGKIEVESMPGKTTFTVSLPINLNEARLSKQ